MSPKSEIRDAILEAQRRALDAALTARAAIHRTSELNDEEVNDPTEITQSSVELGMSGSYESTIDRLRANIAALEAVDVGPCPVVDVGALVDVGEEHYFVAVACDDVEVAGVTIEGISPQSPFAQAMAGKAAGDTFTVLGNDYTIDAVS